ncbi:unnamed protein product [Cuscuta campestris]|uniref:Uncharacterized protein n=1 Tax=Cuscuta campestris TaxID=132261 RepID=A0A484MVL0_9ASTE|nr:unnamed protein product [Cuscuta campestris]
MSVANKDTAAAIKLFGKTIALTRPHDDEKKFGGVKRRRRAAKGKKRRRVIKGRRRGWGPGFHARGAKAWSPSFATTTTTTSTSHVTSARTARDHHHQPIHAAASPFYGAVFGRPRWLSAPISPAALGKNYCTIMDTDN